ncbi:component of IIS longevity pathway SMK-1-domain-containing protein [Suillus paluster]|uniref:component of IIS longevity pathway SMK-1-domain-containing protein n=1 Tax=Suillus paluster TaxID=48578 RepID=UPI001B86406F|nr:component of IIS longevity pathway SMK-1-domain-containing protein [Suillus paluster]KAG1752462.1 component of IIS longevity pathway SMK-1-domain-containing protein [Suillus paluster]
MSDLDAASQSKLTTSGDDQGQPHQAHNLSSQAAAHLFHQEDSHQPPLSLDFTGLSGTEDTLGNHAVNHIDLHDPRDSLIGDLHRVGDHSKLDEMTMLEAVNPSDTHEDTQESRDSDPDIKRVKVYKLIGSQWADQGTAFCYGQFENETNQAFLIARSEVHFDKLILTTRIRTTDVYQRQQDTLIVWTEPDGADYALSFQDAEGCSEVWNFIIEVQRHMNVVGESSVGSSSPRSEHSTTAAIIRSGHLPQPELGNIPDIERAIKTLVRGQAIRERICEYIQREEYIKKMIEVFNMAEDLENVENLHALCSLMQTILVMIHDHGLYEHVLDDSVFFGAVGMLEYDPEFPNHKANYREFLHVTSKFHQPIPIQDIMIQKKIHHTYRLQFLKDVQDTMFLREILSLYVNEEVLTGGKDKDEKREEMDALTANGSTSTARPFSFGPPDNLSENEMALRREVLVLIQQLCVMGKNVPLAARISLFRSLVNRGILFAVQWAFSLPEKDPEAKATMSIAGEVMSALLDHDLNGVRNHITKQASAIERESKEGRPMGEQAETLLRIMCRVGDALKTMLDVSPKDGPDMTPAGLNVKLLRPKDDPGTEKFLDYFYRRCIEVLFKPLNDIPEFKAQTEPMLRLSREKTNLYLYLCDLVCNFAQQHGFRIHFYMLSFHISARMASFLRARDKHLRLAAFRFFRICLKVNNPNFMVHLMKLDVFKPILDLTIQESRRDSLLSASCQEFFEHMRRENIKDPINHCMTKHEPSVRQLAASPLTGHRFMSFIRRWEINIEPPPKEESQPVKSLRDPRHMGRNIDVEEEDYFNADDEEGDNHASLISSQVGGRDPYDENPPFISPHLRGRSSSPVHTALKRKRRGAMVGKGFRPQTLVLPRTPPLKSLVDYRDEDEEEIGPPSPKVPQAPISKATATGSPRSSPLSPAADIPPSPRLSHRQISSRPPPLLRRSSLDEEDNLLESLLRSKSIAPSPSNASSKASSKLSMPSIRLGDKRRREDEEDEQLDLLANKSKRPDLGPRKDPEPSSGRANAVKAGDDPPKKFKLALRGIVTAAPQLSTPVPSEPGAKDGDTG